MPGGDRVAKTYHLDKLNFPKSSISSQNFSVIPNRKNYQFRLLEWSSSFCSSARKVTVVQGLMMVCEEGNRVATLPTMATMDTITTKTTIVTIGQPTPPSLLPTVWLPLEPMGSANQLEMVELGVT